VTLAAEARTYDFIDSSPDEEAKLFAPLGQLFMKMQERQEEIEKANSKPRDQARRPLEILLLGRAAREITGLFRIVTMPSKSKKEKLAALEKAVQINPEGTIQFLLAGLLLDEDKLEEAEKAFRNAATTPALIPSVNRRGYYGASVAAISLFRSHGRNLEDGKRTAGYIRKYFQAGMIAPSKDAQGLFPMAALTGEWDLAGQLVGEGLREKPDNLELVRWRARIDSKNGDYFSAIKATDELLRLKPGDAEMQSLRKETLQKLGDWLAQKRSG
jgi:tetratricopeptide (TPR) repeat protein